MSLPQRRELAGREDFKKLIDELPDAEVEELIDFAQFLRQKAARRSLAAGLFASRAASADDEPDSAGERGEAQAAWNDFQREGATHLEDLRAELGL